MFTLTADIEKCITSFVSVRGDEKGDVSLRRPYIIFEHFQTSQHEKSLRNILTLPLTMKHSHIHWILHLYLNFPVSVTCDEKGDASPGHPLLFFSKYRPQNLT